MKKIFYSILLSGMMVLSACDALDLSPEDYYGSNDFWNQKSQVEMFMTGIHADLRDKYQMPVTLGEFRSEILISDVTSMGEGVYGPPMTNNLLTKDNTGVDDWYEVYPNIMHINLFIRNVDKEIDYLTGTEKSFYLGQAYFTKSQIIATITINVRYSVIITFAQKVSPSIHRIFSIRITFRPGIFN